MLCHVCQVNEATVHLTQIVDGNVKKVDLCEGCSKQKGVDDPTGFSLTDLLMGLGAGQPESTTGPSSVKSVCCPACGYSDQDLKKNGRVGCSDCYQVFRQGLDQLLKTMHKGVQHKGKVPRKLKAKRDFHLRINSLEERLNEAILCEHYEEAADLRDQLKQMRRDFSTKEPEI